MKTIKGIKTKVLLDFNAIFEKFPCNQFVHAFLRGFVSISFSGKAKNTEFSFDFNQIPPLLVQVDKNLKFRNDACSIANQSKSMGETEREVTKFVASLFVESLEPGFSAQLPDETFRGFMNYEKDIWKALVS